MGRGQGAALLRARSSVSFGRERESVRVARARATFKLSCPGRRSSVFSQPKSLDTFLASSPSFSHLNSPYYLLSESHIRGLVMDSVPPAASPHASSVVAAAASGTSVGSVFIKHAGDARALFARVPILVGDAVTDLAERASLKLDWRTSAAYVELFLVKSAGSEDPFTTPTQALIDAVLADGHNVLGEGMPLSLAGIVSGAWIVARLLDPPAAAPGEWVARDCQSPFVLEQLEAGWVVGACTAYHCGLGRHPRFSSLPSLCRRRRR